MVEQHYVPMGSHGQTPGARGVPSSCLPGTSCCQRPTVGLGFVVARVHPLDEGCFASHGKACMRTSGISLNLFLRLEPEQQHVVGFTLPVSGFAELGLSEQNNYGGLPPSAASSFACQGFPAAVVMTRADTPFLHV